MFLSFSSSPITARELNLPFTLIMALKLISSRWGKECSLGIFLEYFQNIIESHLFYSPLHIQSLHEYWSVCIIIFFFVFFGYFWFWNFHFLSFFFSFWFHNLVQGPSHWLQQHWFRQRSHGSSSRFRSYTGGTALYCTVLRASMKHCYQIVLCTVLS